MGALVSSRRTRLCLARILTIYMNDSYVGEKDGEVGEYDGDVGYGTC